MLAVAVAYSASDPHEIIRRCTRNGTTAWQHVAAQMGRSVDSVRCQYDPNYMNARAFAGQCVEVKTPPEQEPIDDNDMSSPYAKGPGLKDQILHLLDRQAMSAEALSSLLLRPRNSIRARLDSLHTAGRVWHDGRHPRTWGLTEADGSARQYGATPLSAKTLGGVPGAHPDIAGIGNVSALSSGVRRRGSGRGQG